MGFFSFSKKKKAGNVYLGESTRKSGSKKIYTGMTRRPVKKRWGEHISSVKSNSNRTWVSRGKSFRPLGAITSRNPEKAEKTIKKLKPYQKRYLSRGASMRYRKKQRETN